MINRMSFNVAVLASHTGTNLRALTAAGQPTSAFTVTLIISNNSSSGALAHAREESITGIHLSGRTHPEPDALDQTMLAALRDHNIDLGWVSGRDQFVGFALAASPDQVDRVV